MSEAGADDLQTAYQAACDRLLAEVREACAAPRDWPHGVAAGIRAAYDFAAREPAAARLLSADIFLDRDHGLRRYDHLIASLAVLLRDAAGNGLASSPISEETLISGLVGMVQMRVALNRTAELPAAVPEAIYFVLIPYLGTEQAIAISGLPSAVPTPGACRDRPRWPLGKPPQHR